MTFGLYSVFHLNMAYSSISVENRPLVIENCYWPLLELIESENWPCGIEFSGWTLEQIVRIDPLWLERLNELASKNLVEVIGSGYAQIIGPLVPHAVNQKNLELGWKTYGELLSVFPRIALIPEQAFSASYLGLLSSFGLNGFVMDWNNPRSYHPDWPATALYGPQLVKDSSGTSTPVLWNHSVTFQKFQRFAHGETELGDFMSWLIRHREASPNGFLSLYGNDAEVFDFRPGRYMSEAQIHPDGEWNRIKALIGELHSDSRFSFLLPSEVLEQGNPTNLEPLMLETSAQPIPVKKQQKYNVVRWAISGTNDFEINARCHQIAQGLLANPGTKNSDWKELLFLWSSDFRTHIEQNRWMAFQKGIGEMHQKWALGISGDGNPEKFAPVDHAALEAAGIRMKKASRFLEFDSPRTSVSLDLLRGLAIHSFTDREVSIDPVFGSIPIGTFEGIHLAADWYSGNLTFERPGLSQVTDLLPCEPRVVAAGSTVTLATTLQTAAGVIDKTVEIDFVSAKVRVSYRVRFGFELGSLRFGYVTLLRTRNGHSPKPWYSSHLGGKKAEIFELGGHSFDFGRPVSSRITASHGLGATEGLVTISGGESVVISELDMTNMGALGMIDYQEDPSGALLRHYFSVLEIDDTSKPPEKPIDLSFGVTFRCAPTRG